MSNFTVRIELNAASKSDYDKLHKVMSEIGFSRFILGDDGQRYHLPTAEYDLNGSSYTAKQVLDLSLSAISCIGCVGEVLVSEAVARAWSLRPLVQQQPDVKASPFRSTTAPFNIFGSLNPPAAPSLVSHFMVGALNK